MKQPKWEGNTLFLSNPVEVGELKIETITFKNELSKSAYDQIPVSGLAVLNRSEIWPIAELLCDQSAEFLRERLSLVDKDEVVSKTVFLSVAHQIQPS